MCSILCLAQHSGQILRTGLKPYARTRIVAFPEPTRLSLYNIQLSPFQNEKAVSSLDEN